MRSLRHEELSHATITRDVSDGTSRVIDITYKEPPSFEQRKLPFFERRYQTNDICLRSYSMAQYLPVVEANAAYFRMPNKERLADTIRQGSPDNPSMPVNQLIDETHAKNTLLAVIYGVSSQNNTHRGTLSDVNTAKHLRVEQLHDPDALYDHLVGARMDNRGKNRMEDIIDVINDKGGGEAARQAYSDAPDRARRRFATCHGVGYKTASMIATCWDVAKNQIPLDKWVARQMVGLDLDVRVTAGYGKPRDTSGRRIVSSITQAPSATSKGNKTEYTDTEAELLEVSKQLKDVHPGFTNDDESFNGTFLATFYWLGPKWKNEQRLNQQDLFGNTLQGSMYLESFKEAKKAWEGARSAASQQPLSVQESVSGDERRHGRQLTLYDTR